MPVFGDKERVASESVTLKAPVPRPAISNLAPYVPGKSKGTVQGGRVYKLSSNESALGASPSAIAAYELASKNLHLYPDGASAKLREKIGALHNIDADNIICGAGSDEILQLVCRAYLGEDDNIVQSAHGFLVYAIAAQACGAEVRFAREVDLTVDVDAMLAEVDERTRIVFVANPNNPTGSYLPIEEIQRLHEGLRRDILLVIDAAYAEYMEEDDYNAGIELVECTRNVIMTRTFSKIYGLGSLRLGWAYGSPSVIDALNRIRGPFNVSAAAQHAGEAALDDQDFVDRNRSYNSVERNIMTQRLRGLGLEVQRSFGNFLLVRFPQKPGFSAADMQTFLAENNVIVREMTAYQLPDYLRISIGAKEANERVLDLLAQKFTG